jgi:predicted secreted hydrolase
MARDRNAGATAWRRGLGLAGLFVRDAARRAPRRAVLILLCALGWGLAGCGPDTDGRTPRSSLSVAELLGGEAEGGYARALGPRPIRFPEDHGPHPDYKTEWWYFTGNLAEALEAPEGGESGAAREAVEGGRRFGFQLTFFRSALAPQPLSGRTSHWATRQLYMAHFAVTDVRAQRFAEEERFARGAVGLAGVMASPFRVWLEGWEARSVGDDLWPLRVRAQTEEVGLELQLRRAKPIVLQGERGYSRKGSDPGNASYYYSIPRMRARGQVRTAEGTFDVEGLVWLDREWSTSVLQEGQVGWDWFALQLSAGRDLMMYQLRRDDGSPDAHSHAVLMDADGSKTELDAEEFTIEPTGWWTSEETGARYPSRWRLSAPALGLDLRVRSLVPDQELNVSVAYWEGAVSVDGELEGRPTSGRGYAELTGYADAASPMPAASR